MMDSKYQSQTIHLQRINPQFVGIAQKFASHKKNRVTIQKQKMRKTTNFEFIKKMDQTLQRDIEKQKYQLQRVKQIRQRYNDDARHKNQQQRKRRQNIQYLHGKSVEYRTNHKKKICQAIGNLMSDRKQKHSQLKKQQSQLRQFNKKQKNRQSIQNKYKFHSIEYSKHQGNQRINQYFKMKNKQSLNDYLMRIKNQDKKANNFKQQIKKLEKNLKKYSKRVQKKKNYLQQLNSEISSYTGQDSLKKSRYHDRFEVFSSNQKRSVNTKKIISGYSTNQEQIN